MRWPMRWLPPAPMASGFTPARRGSKACRLARTATCRRWTTAASIGSSSGCRQRLSASMAASALSTRRKPISPMSTASCSAAPPIRRRRCWPMSTGASTAPTTARRRTRSWKRCCPSSRPSWRRARACRTSPATCSACSTGFPARARGAASSPSARSKPGAGVEVVEEALAAVTPEPSVEAAIYASFAESLG